MTKKIEKLELAIFSEVFVTVASYISNSLMSRRDYNSPIDISEYISRFLSWGKPMRTALQYGFLCYKKKKRKKNLVPIVNRVDTGNYVLLGLMQ